MLIRITRWEPIFDIFKKSKKSCKNIINQSIKRIGAIKNIKNGVK